MNVQLNKSPDIEGLKHTSYSRAGWYYTESTLPRLLQRAGISANLSERQRLTIDCTTGAHVKVSAASTVRLLVVTFIRRTTCTLTSLRARATVALSWGNLYEV